MYRVRIFEMLKILTPKPFCPLVIAFDVDDTLLLPPEATQLDRDVPNYETIAIYRWFQQGGNYMIIWSGGGEDYARMWGDKLGLAPDEYRMKGHAEDIDLAFDDSDIETLVPNGKLVRVRRIANSKRRSTRGVERAKLNLEGRL